MALTPQNNEAFLREVDDELRRDQLSGIGRRYGVWIIVLVVAVLVGFGGWLYWQHHRTSVAGEQGEALAAAMESVGNQRGQQASAPLARLAKSDVGAIRASAIFTEADLLLGREDVKGAAAKFASIANDGSVAQPFRDLALVRQTAAEYDTLKPQAVIDRLRGLAVKDSPWFGSAGEMVAIAYMRAGRNDQAGRLFAQIAESDTVPDSIRQRAVQMAGSLGVDAVNQDATANAAAER